MITLRFSLLTSLLPTMGLANVVALSTPAVFVMISLPASVAGEEDMVKGVGVSVFNVNLPTML